MKREVIVKWKIKASETARILAMLPELAEKTKGEEGNITYAIYQSEADPNELILHECYVDAEAAEAHRNSEHYQKIVATEIIPHLEVREVTIVKQLS
jgi:quinol monooxygenase YgiN